MRLSVKSGKTLLVDGPASATLISGSASVLSAMLKIGSKVIVRNGKRLPFEVIKDATFELAVSENSTCQEIDGSAILDTWRNAVDEILKLRGNASVLILGGIDSGKTSLCTYLANCALNKKRKVAIIDGDLGQSDIGPPTTIGLASLAEPTVDIFGVEADHIVFVGATSPSVALNTSLNALRTLKEKCIEMRIDFLIVNTDGWIDGEDAENYKAQVVDLFSPNVILAIQEGGELKPILERLQDLRTIVVEIPKMIKRRSREVRKALRELAYKKYLKDAKFQCYTLNYVEIKGCSIEGNISERLENEKGLLVGLEDQKGRFLGIGILCEINRERRNLKIYTPVREQSPRVLLGQVRLSLNGSEIG